MKKARRNPSIKPLALPHERDEFPEAPGPKRRVIEQAGRDLAAGRVDTDNYSRAATIAESTLRGDGGAHSPRHAEGTRQRRRRPP